MTPPENQLNSRHNKKSYTYLLFQASVEVLQKDNNIHIQCITLVKHLDLIWLPFIWNWLKPPSNEFFFYYFRLLFLSLFMYEFFGHTYLIFVNMFFKSIIKKTFIRSMNSWYEGNQSIANYISKSLCKFWLHCYFH